MSAKWGWLDENAAWLVEYAGVITPQNLTESVNETLDILNQNRNIILLLDFTEVMFTADTLDFQHNFQPINDMWGHSHVQQLVFLVPGKLDNPIGQMIFKRCERLNVTSKIAFYNDWDEFQAGFNARYFEAS